MFGFSLPKLIFTAAVIAAAWYGFKFMSRRGAGSKPGAIGDTVRCSTCGDFVAAEGAENCGKTGCPYGQA